MYEYIKEYYDLGLYDENDLDIFINAKWITAEEKQKIVATE